MLTARLKSGRGRWRFRLPLRWLAKPFASWVETKADVLWADFCQANWPQPPFQMNPDGTGQTEYYGNNSWFPTSISSSIRTRSTWSSDKAKAET